MASKIIIKTKCDKRGHDLYLAKDTKEKLGLIYKCMYCTHTEPIFKKH